MRWWQEVLCCVLVLMHTRLQIHEGAGDKRSACFIFSSYFFFPGGKKSNSVDFFAVSGKLQSLLQDAKESLDVVGLRVVAHEPDAPDLAGRTAQTAGDLDAMLSHQVWRHDFKVDVIRHQDAGHRRQPDLWILDKQFQTEILESIVQEFGTLFMPRPTGFQSFFGDDGKSFSQAVHGRYGSGVMVFPGLSLAVPIVDEPVEVEVKGGAARLSTPVFFHRRLVEGDRGRAGGTAQYLLRPRVNNVHFVFVHVERRSTETGNGIDAEDDSVFVAERADAVDGMRHGGRGLAVREEEEGRMVLLQRRLDFIQTESLAV